MKRSSLLSVQIIIAFFLLLTTTIYVISINKTDNCEKNSENIELNYNTAMPINQDLIRYEAPNDHIVLNSVESETPLNATYTPFDVSMTQLNVVINIINYAGDYSNYISTSEISNILNNYRSYVNPYFNVMSYGKLTVSFDYVVSTISAYTYEELKAMNANYIEENNLFQNGILNCYDEYGLKKTLAFSTYHEKINLFAGDAGEWNTFLWPHSWGKSAALITLMENNCGYSTFIHETMHFMDLPDLYSYNEDNSNIGVGSMDMMANNYEVPVVNAYYRERLGWINSSQYNDGESTQFKVIPASQTGTLDLNIYHNTYTYSSNNTIAYKFGENSSKNEFFVMEYRIQNSANMNQSGNSGVVIYRVHSTADGNANGHLETEYAEIIFMGNFALGVNSYYYISSCVYGAGKTCNSLVYTAGVGYSNIVSGSNSNITVKVNSINSSCANVTITFPGTPKDILDLSAVDWNYNSSSPWYYSGSRWNIKLINLPFAINASYNGVTSATYAGNYQVSVNLRYDTDKYELINCNFATSINWEIKKTKINLSYFSWDYGSPFTYNKETHSVYLVNSYTGLSIAYTNNSFVNAGNYTASAICTVPDNTYELIGSVPTLSWKISQINISANIHNQTSKYGEALNTLTYTITGTVLDGDNLNLSITKAGDLNVGKYLITGFCPNKNYNVTFSNGNYTITPASLSILIHDKSSNFGETLKELTYEITAGELYYGDVLNIVLVKEAGENVGEYAITTNYVNSNYDITFTNGKYTILTRDIDYEISNTNFVYNGLYQWFSVNVSFPEEYSISYGLTDGNYNYTSPIRIDSFKNAKEVGTVVYIKIEANGCNTVITSTTVKITPANMNLEVHEKSSVYGKSIMLLTYSLSAEPYGDDNLNINIQKEAGLQVGEYNITATYSNSNYLINITNNTYTITPASLSILINDKYSYFGETLKELTYGITAGELYYGDVLNIVLVKEAGESIGEYAITTNYENPNYYITFINGTYSILLREIVYDISNTNFIYNGLYRWFSVNVSFPEEYSISYGLTDGNYNYTSPILLNKFKNANSVGAVVYIKIEASDCETVFTSATIKIFPVDMSLEVDDKTSVYGEDLKELTFTISREPYGYDNLNINIEKEPGLQFGEYDIIATYNNSNYNISITNGKYTITKRNILMTIDNKTSVYGEDLKELTYTLSAEPYEDDDLSIVIIKKGDMQFGEYEITATYSNSNYYLSITKGVYTITKRNILMVIDNKTSVYGESIKGLTYTLSEELYGDDNLNINIKKQEGRQVGEYNITATYSNSNYDITIIPGKYEITKRNIIVTLKDQIKTTGDNIEISQIDYELDLINGYSILYVDLPKISIYTEETDISVPKSYNLYFALDNPNYNVVVSNTAKLIVEQDNKKIILLIVAVGGPILLSSIIVIGNKVSKSLICRKWK